MSNTPINNRIKLDVNPNMTMELIKEEDSILRIIIVMNGIEVINHLTTLSKLEFNDDIVNMNFNKNILDNVEVGRSLGEIFAR